MAADGFALPILGWPVDLRESKSSGALWTPLVPDDVLSITTGNLRGARDGASE